MFWTGTAAAAHHPHAVLAHVFGEYLREGLGLLGVNRLPVNVHRQPGVGDAGNGQGGVFAQILDRGPHVLRTGGAVQPDYTYPQAFQDSEGGSDIGSKQHFPVDIQRYLGLNGQDNILLRKGAVDALDGSFDLQNILLGFEQQ